MNPEYLIADNPELHAIRMDVYLGEEDEDGQAGEIFDIGPDKNDNPKDVAELPKRARFYHARLDGKNIKAGSSDYSVLRNVVVIFIMPYDPFGLNRMVYTVGRSFIRW